MSDVSFRVNGPQVIHESIDGEVIIINLETGNYYSAKGSAADVWDVLQASPAISAAGVVDAVAAGYGRSPDELAGSIRPFVEQLVDEGLLAQTDQSSDLPAAVTSSNGEGVKATFEPPVLEKYTDMQDLVLLDPVHEVDEQGWPQRPDAAAGSPRA